MREDDYDCWFVDTRLNFEQRRLPIPLPIVPTASSHQESAPPTLCSMGNGFSALSAIIWLESAVNRGSGGVVNHRRDRNTRACIYGAFGWRETPCDQLYAAATNPTANQHNKLFLPVGGLLCDPCESLPPGRGIVASVAVSAHVEPHRRELGRGGGYRE